MDLFWLLKNSCSIFLRLNFKLIHHFFLHLSAHLSISGLILDSGTSVGEGIRGYLLTLFFPPFITLALAPVGFLWRGGV